MNNGDTVKFELGLTVQEGVIISLQPPNVIILVNKVDGKYVDPKELVFPVSILKTGEYNKKQKKVVAVKES